MTKLDNEVCELTMSELGEISGGGGISIELGYAHIDMAWGAGGCKMINIYSGDRTTTADNGKC